jgi:hypothetical protein
MVKGSRKKIAIQGCARTSAARLGQLLGSDDFASISAMIFEAEKNIGGDHALTAVNIVQMLARCESLADQVILIKENKAALRSRLHLRCDAKLVLYLYMHPATDPMRKNLDWVIEFMIKGKDNQYSLIEEVREASNRVLTGVSQLNLGEIDTQTFLETTSSLVCMGLLHRDLPWFLGEGESQELTPSLLSFCQLMMRYLKQCCQFMRPEWIEKDSAAMGSRIVTHTEACADLARSLAAAVKTPTLRLCRIPEDDAKGRQQWLTLVEMVVDTTTEMLQACRIIGKDASSALATVLVSFTRLCGAASDGPYQVLYFISLLSMDESCDDTRSSFGILHKVPTQLAKKVSVLPLAARMATVRATLTVYDSSEVGTPMSSLVDLVPKEIILSLKVDMTVTHLSLLLGPALDSVIRYCSSNQQPSVQLFAVQTLESLLSAQ